MSPLHFRFTPPRLWPNIDWVLMGAVLALSLCGILTIWGASATEGTLGPLRGYAQRQLRWVIIGLFVMVGMMTLDYRWLRRAVWPLYGLILLLLLLVLAHGTQVKGAKSWFIMNFPGFRLQFQPAEPGKLAMAIVLAHYLAGRMTTFRRLHHTIVPLILVGLPIALILRQPDLGTSVVFIPMTFVMFYVAGLRKRVFVLFAAALIAVAVTAYPHLKPYQVDRIQTFLHPGQDALGKGYNVIQAQTALGSGGFFGKGWGRGTQTSFRFLPEYQTDFIFPTLGEQFGFVGCLVALSLYAIILFRIVYLAGRVKDLFGVLLLSGLATVLTVHLILNIGMVAGLLPVTGLPLPFFSYGGSFMLTCFAMIGLIVSVGMRRELERS